MLFPITVVMLVPIVALKFVADSSGTDDSPVMIVGRIGSDEKNSIKYHYIVWYNSHVEELRARPLQRFPVE